MRYLKLLIIFCLSYISCSDENPECIDEMIENFKQNQEGCTNANIIKYEFQGEEVYAFSDGQCISDGGTAIWDLDCNSICFLGGIAGFTECDGLDFYELAEEIKTVWMAK